MHDLIARGSGRPRRAREPSPGKALPVWRIGIGGELVGILCCVGPTVLVLIGVLSVGTAYVWAIDLYNGYAWWFRIAGLATLAATVVIGLRRRRSCSAAGVRQLRWRLTAALAVAIGAYVLLYALTTWLGTLAR